MYRHPTDFSFDNFNADIRALFFDNRLAVSSKHVSCVVDFRSDFFISKYMGSMQGCLVIR